MQNPNIIQEEVWFSLLSNSYGVSIDMYNIIAGWAM